ncbi:ATP-dependent DNA helicase [Aureococcus anophagefferens]|nr:ATP-dependent DNA helicase [Aureococcus anophagefferens]
MARRRALACVLVVAAASALAPPLALPRVELYLDLRMTIRRPLDAISTINQSPSGVIMWESASAPAHDPELDGLNVLAVDPGSRNIDGLPAVRPAAGGPSFGGGAAGSARVLVSLYDKAMLSACCEKLVLGSLTGSGLVSLGGGEDAPGEPGSIGVALPPDPLLWKLAKTYASG